MAGHGNMALVMEKVGEGRGCCQVPLVSGKNDLLPMDCQRMVVVQNTCHQNGHRGGSLLD